MALESQVLSPKAKENLQRKAELRQKDNKFVKIEPSEKKILQFNPEKIEQVEAEFSGKEDHDIAPFDWFNRFFGSGSRGSARHV